MIVFKGIKKLNNVAFLIMAEESWNKNKFHQHAPRTIEIPIEVAVADRISKYLSKIATAPTEIVERGNDEESE